MCGPERLGEGQPSLSAIRGSFVSLCGDAKYCLAGKSACLEGAGVCLCWFAGTQMRGVFIEEMLPFVHQRY